MPITASGKNPLMIVLEPLRDYCNWEALEKSLNNKII